MAAAILTGCLIAFGALVLVALLLRATSAGRPEAGSVPGPLVPEPEADPAPETANADERVDQDEVLPPEGDGEGDGTDGGGGDDRKPVPHALDGTAFVPDGHGVRVLPPMTGEELAAYEAISDEEWRKRDTFAWEQAYAPLQKYLIRLRAPHLFLEKEDLRSARVVPPAGNASIWRLETIGRDGDFAEYAFESEHASAEALGMLASREIFHPTEDDDGRPVAPDPWPFEEARRVALETEAQLELPEDPLGPVDAGEEQRADTH